jgi:outer membrane biosynthesis protein TonB
MNVNHDAFARQLADLIGRFADLGAKLGEAARELQDGGAPPADALVEALAAGRLEFVELRAEIILAAETLGLAVPDAIESAKSLEPVLAAMAEGLEGYQRRAAFEESRARVIALLDRVIGIRHQDDESFEPLVIARDKAAELKSAALALGDATAEQVESLEAGAQPFADLLTMLEATEALDDARFSALEESVAEAFGRQIAVAVARGRLVLPGQAPRAPEPEPEPPAPVRPVDAPRAPEPVRAAPRKPVVAAPPREVPPPKYEPPPRPVRQAEPVVAAASAPAAPLPAAARGDTSGTDDSAQWWLSASARWSGWKNTLGFPEATREELAKYPYLLSVPIQQSPEFEEGLLAYGYSIILEHVDKLSPGCVANALNNLKPGQTTPIGTQLYEYLVAQGRLTETYPDFVKNVLRAAVPEPGPWVQARIIHSKDDTRVFRRPTPRLGETEQTAQRFLAENQRFKEHKFDGPLPPLTTRFFLIQAELKDAHSLEAKLTVGGAPSSSGFVVTVPAAGKASKMDVRPLSAEGTPVAGIGRDHGTIWFAILNADPVRAMEFELGLTLRKDTRGLRK